MKLAPAVATVVLAEAVLSAGHCEAPTILTLTYPADGPVILRADAPIRPTVFCLGEVEGLPVENYHLHVEVEGDFTIQRAPITVTTTASAPVMLRMRS